MAQSLNSGDVRVAAVGDDRLGGFDEAVASAEQDLRALGIEEFQLPHELPKVFAVEALVVNLLAAPRRNQRDDVLRQECVVLQVPEVRQLEEILT